MNYYQLLGLPRQATREQIRAAYLRLAGELHPDRHVGNGAKERAEREKFQRILEAYEVLRDPEKRRAYDLQHGAIPPPRRTHEATATAAAAAAAARGPVRVASGVRRDVPDDWIRGSRRPVRLGTWLRTSTSVVLVLLVVTAVVPSVGRMLESQLSPAIDSPAESSELTKRPQRRSAREARWGRPPTLAPLPKITQKILDAVPKPREENSLVRQPREDAADVEDEVVDNDLYVYTLRRSLALDDDDFELPFDSQVVASQDYSDQLGSLPAPTSDDFLPTLPHDEVDRASGSQAPHRRGLNTRKAPGRGQDTSATYAPPQDILAPLPDRSSIDSIDTGVSRYDEFFPERPSSLEKPPTDSFFKRPGNTFGSLPELPGTKAYTESLLKGDLTDGYKTFDFSSPSRESNFSRGTTSGFTPRVGLDAPHPRDSGPFGRSRSRSSQMSP